MYAIRSYYVDRDLLPRTDVDRVGLVVFLGGQDDRLGGVVDIEKLPGYRYALVVTGSPDP